jgi:CheY-like chemotaxis protein
VSGDQIANIIKALAGLFWVLLAVFVVWLLRQPLTAAVSRLASFEAFGVKFALSGSAALDAAIELAEKNPAWPVEVPAADRKAAIDRANANRSVFEGAEILWVDDRPSNNRNEARMLRSFGALITFAATTDEALDALKAGTEQHHAFDLILSDISRDVSTRDATGGLTTVADVTAGIDMLPRLRNAGFLQPVIYYVGSPKPDAGVPAGAFGVTNRPDQLLQLVIDALSRVRRKT